MAKVERDMEHTPSYLAMLSQVHHVDENAAWFIEESAKRGLAARVGFLTYVFTFADTPQGYDFWHNICSKIERGWDNGQPIEMEYELDD